MITINNSGDLKKLSCDYVKDDQFYTDTTENIPKAWNSVTNYAYTNIIKYNVLNNIDIKRNSNIAKMKDDFKDMIKAENKTIKHKAIVEALNKRFLNKSEREMLLETGNKKLIYSSKYDQFLGIDEKGEGKNILGKELEKIRNSIRQEYKVKLKERKYKNINDEIFSEFLYYHVVNHDILTLNQVIEHTYIYYNKKRVKREYAKNILMLKYKSTNSRLSFFQKKLKECLRNKNDNVIISLLHEEYINNKKLYNSYEDITYNPVKYRNISMIHKDVYDNLITNYKIYIKQEEYNLSQNYRNNDELIERVSRSLKYDEIEYDRIISSHFGLNKKEILISWKHISAFKDYHDSNYNEFRLIFDLYNRNLLKNSNYNFAPRSISINEMKLESEVINMYLENLLKSRGLEVSKDNINLFKKLYKSSLHLIRRHLYVEYKTQEEFIPKWVPTGKGMKRNTKTFISKDLNKKIERRLRGVKIGDYVYTQIDDADHVEEEKERAMNTYISFYIRAYKNLESDDIDIFKNANSDFIGKIKETVWEKYINKDTSLNIKSDSKRHDIINKIDRVLQEYRNGVVEADRKLNKHEMRNKLITTEDRNAVLIQCKKHKYFYTGYIIDIINRLNLRANYIKRTKDGNIEAGLINRNEAIILNNHINNSYIYVGESDVKLVSNLLVDTKTHSDSNNIYINFEYLKEDKPLTEIDIIKVLTDSSVNIIGDITYTGDYYIIPVDDVKKALELNESKINDNIIMNVKTDDSHTQREGRINIDIDEKFIDSIRAKKESKSYKLNSSKGIIHINKPTGKYGFLSPSYTKIFNMNGMAFPTINHYLYFKSMTSFKTSIPINQDRKEMLKLKRPENIDIWKQYICYQPKRKYKMSSYISIQELSKKAKEYRSKAIKNTLKIGYITGMKAKFKIEPYKRLLHNTGDLKIKYDTDGINLGEIMEKIRDDIVYYPSSDVIYRVPKDKLIMGYLNKICKKWINDIIAIAEIRNVDYYKKSGTYTENYKDSDWGNIRFPDIKFIVDDYIYKIHKYGMSSIPVSAPDKFKRYISSIIIDVSKNLRYNKNEIGEFLWYRITNVSYELTYNTKGLDMRERIMDHYDIKGEDVKITYEYISKILLKIFKYVGDYIKPRELYKEYIMGCVKLLVTSEHYTFIEDMIDEELESVYKKVNEEEEKIKEEISRNRTVIHSDADDETKKKARNNIEVAIGKKGVILSNIIKDNKTISKLKTDVNKLFNIDNDLLILIIHHAVEKISETLNKEKIVQRRIKILK